MSDYRAEPIDEADVARAGMSDADLRQALMNGITMELDRGSMHLVCQPWPRKLADGETETTVLRVTDSASLAGAPEEFYIEPLDGVWWLFFWNRTLAQAADPHECARVISNIFRARR